MSQKDSLKGSPFLGLGLILLIGLTLTGLVSYSLHHGRQVDRQHRPHLRASEQVRLELTEAHLALADVLVAARFDDTEDIWRRLDEVQWYLQALLRGGRNRNGTIQPVTDSASRGTLGSLSDRVEGFRELSLDLLVDVETDTRTPSLASRYHRMYHRLAGDAEALRNRLERVLAADLRRFRTVQAVLVLLSLALTLSAGLSLRRYTRWRSRVETELRSEIEARVETESELRRSEGRFRGLTEKAADYVVIIDPQGALRYTSPSVTRDLGWTSDRLMGKPAMEIVHPTSAGELETLLKSLTGHPGKSIRLPDFAVPDSDGLCRWFDGVATNLEHVPGINGIVANCREITERRAAENALAESRNMLASVLDSIPVRVVWKDRELIIRGCNQAFARDAGADAATVVGRTDFDLLPPEQAALYRAEDQRVLDTGEPRHNAEHPHRWPDNTVTWLQTSRVPLRDRDGAIVGVLGVYQDISGRKKAEGELHESMAQLRRTNRELQDIALWTSRDLREPLGEVCSLSERLRETIDDRLDDRSSDYLRRCHTSAVRMKTLVEDLLALMRVSTESIPVKPIDLSLVARGVVSELAAEIEAARAVVRLEELPMAPADGGRMRLLFRHLIANALKFHRPGVPPEVTVYAKVFNRYEGPSAPLARKSKWCRILFEDNGIGFDEKHLDRIFTVFQRLHDREDYEGTGLGLALCKKIVQHHGGTISARSRPGHGTTFIVTLPLNPPEDELPGTLSEQPGATAREAGQP